MFRKISLLLIFLLVIVAITGCAPEEILEPDPVNGDEDPVEEEVPDLVSIAYPAEPPNLDWHSTTAAATQVPAINIYETLYAINRDYVAVPMLAKDLPVLSDDQLSYTIELRQGVKFHNGEEMTADDVISSLDRWGERSTIGRRMYSNLDSIEKLDNYTIRLSFSEVYAPLLNTIATPVMASAIMPKSVIDTVGEDVITDVEHIVGTGPYKLAEWTRGSMMKLELFEEYSVLESDDGGLAGKKEAVVKEVEIHFASDSTVRLNGLVTGMYDYAAYLTAEVLDVLNREEMDIKIDRPYYNRVAILNTSKPPFDNPTIRKAAALAIDCEQIMLATEGSPELYELDGGIYMPEHRELYTQAGTEDYNANDIERAQALLEEAGYNNEPVVFLTTGTYEWQVNASTVAISNLIEAGFNVETELLEWVALLDKRRDSNAWDIVQTALGAGYLEPGAQLYLSGNWPIEGYYAVDDEMDALLQEWNSAFTPEKRTELIEKMQIQLYEDQPIIKYGNYFSLNGLNPKLKHNMEFYQPTFWNMWLEN